MKENTKKELEEIFDDDLLQCEIIDTKESDSLRVDIVLWRNDTFSVCETDKISRKMVEHEVGGSYGKAKEVFDSYVA